MVIYTVIIDIAIYFNKCLNIYCNKYCNILYRYCNTLEEESISGKKF